MKRISLGRWIAIGMLAICMMMYAAFASSAAEKTTIDHVTLSFDTSDIEIGSSSSVIYVSSQEENEYYVSNDQGSATNLSGTWTKGDIPKFKITIKAEDGYKFDTSAAKSSSYYTFNGSTVTFSKVSTGSSSITLTVKMAKLTSNVSKDDLAVSDLEWADDSFEATWDDADNVDKYSVKLYKGSSLITNIETQNNYYNFASNITSTGSYTFKVRAYYAGSWGNWETSDTLYVESEDLSTNSTVQSGWYRDNNGWWYRNSDGSYTVNGWQYINNKWYFFNSSGYMSTGWINWKNAWYYCGSSGDMYVNTTTPDGYRVDSNGVWVR